jgi:hypothetical protein
MGYKNLKNFKTIFNRPDFDYVSDQGKIKNVVEIIRYRLLAPSAGAQYSAQELNVFVENLETFYESIVGRNIPDLQRGFSAAVEVLQTCIGIFKQPELKRANISRAYIRKFYKRFLHGLSVMLKGIRIAFDPDIISSTGIDSKQLKKYMLDNKEGLGRHFLFNNLGRNAFARRIKDDDIPIKELIVAERLLLRPSANQVRTYHGWKDLGLNHAPVRILSQQRTFGKERVYFFYRSGEHREYENQLVISPDKVDFRAAA